MSSVPRATFDALKTGLDARMADAVSDYAAERHLTYDPQAIFDQCSWAQDASVDILMFGLDVFPADSDDDDGEPMIPAPSPANDTTFRPRLSMVAGILVALTAGLWTGSPHNGADAFAPAARSFVHDATLPVTSTSSLLPDATG